MPPGRLHLVILAAAVAAFFLVGAAQAAAGTMQVTLAGTGTGMVESDIGSENTGTPAIECSNILTEEIAVCENTMPAEEAFETLRAKAGPGSVLAGGSGWSITEGSDLFETEFEVPSGCNNKEFQETEIIPTFGAPVCWVGPEEGAGAKVTVTFNLIEFPLTINTNGGTGTGTVECDTGSGPEACEPEYPEATVVTVIASEDPGSEFASWSGECDSVTGNECEVEMDAPKTVTAAFGLVPTHTLSIGKAGTGSGSVTCNGGACASSYAEGTKVTLAATAASGSTFAGFSAGTGSTAGCSTSPCAFTIEADSTVTATFNAETCTTDCSPPPVGKAKVSPTASVKAGKAALKLTCSGGACKGTLKLTAKLKQRHKTKNVVIGKASFSIAAGASATLKVKLSGAAKKELGKVKALKAKVTGTGVVASTVKLKQK